MVGYGRLRGRSSVSEAKTGETELQFGGRGCSYQKSPYLLDRSIPIALFSPFGFIFNLYFYRVQHAWSSKYRLSDFSVTWK